MLKQEFTDRTGYKPTEQEFEEINALYMATDDDKDTFCIKWKRANKELVSWQKRARKAIAQATLEIGRLYREARAKADYLSTDPLLNFYNARYARLIEAEAKRDNLRRQLDWLIK